MKGCMKGEIKWIIFRILANIICSKYKNNPSELGRCLAKLLSKLNLHPETGKTIDVTKLLEDEWE